MMSELSNVSETESLSLENCDKEPVHIPGHIQGFATLIATDEKLKIITHCSENAKQTLGKAPSEIIGQPLSALFDGSLIHDLNNTLSLSSAQYQRERVGRYFGNGIYFDVWAHISDRKPILELEPIRKSKLDQTNAIVTVRSLLSRLQKVDDLQATLNDAVTGLRNLTGFDRVMAYKFDPNGDGEVIAEARSSAMEPFLGLRFPKWDIPNQAREIMKKLPLRMIADVHGMPVSVISIDPSASPLDLTFATCRGQSPIHSEYLSNMGIRSTMTLSIVVNNALWGLFAFHNKDLHNIGPNLRGAAELFVQFFSLQMVQRLEKGRNKAQSITLAHKSALLEATDTAQDMKSLVHNIAKPFCTLLKANGLAMVTESGIVQYGTTPPPDVIMEIGNKLLTLNKGEIIAHECFSEIGFDNGPSAGGLLLRLHVNEPSYVIFFREEASISVTWAGAPKKNVIEDDEGVRLKPRGSFAAYKQAVKDRCEPWDEETLISANEIRLAITEADSVLFRRLSQKEERQRSVYIAELNHRVRNILALIRSLSRKAHESSDSLESYARALEQRIKALGVAHDLAANQITSGVSINEIFETEAKPFLGQSKNQLAITGTSYLIRADAAPIFSLVIHELVTNCVKYGALSNASGRIDIHIQPVEDMIEILWKEQGGPSVEKPAKQGFGLGLIENAIPYELEGESHVEFLPTGLRVSFKLPETIVEILPESLKTPNENAVAESNKDIPKKVLVLEDSLMVAMDMSDMLRAVGVQDVEICSTVARAAYALNDMRPDVAVLDVSLRDGTSFSIGKDLQSMGVPFCFVTGYGSEIGISDDFPKAVILQKPTDIDTLRATLMTLYKKAKT